MKPWIFAAVLILFLHSSLQADQLEVSEAAQGRNLVLKRGDTLVVTLASNRTTGYGWGPRFSNPGVLLVQGEALYLPTKTNLVGAGGLEKWTFRGERIGKTTLTMVYARPWEKETPPMKTLSWRIIVRP